MQIYIYIYMYIYIYIRILVQMFIFYFCYPKPASLFGSRMKQPPVLYITSQRPESACLQQVIGDDVLHSPAETR